MVALVALLPQALAQTCATINPANAPTFASGYSGRVVMNGLKGPRGIVFDKQGNLLTSEQGGYGIRYIQLTDNGGTNVCVKSSKQLVADTSLNHGLELSPDGKILFASSVSAVYAWDYDGTTGTVSNKKTVVSGTNNGGHNTRTLLIPKSSPDTLLVSRGSNGNIDSPTAQESSGRSQIRAFSITKIRSAAADYLTGDILGWGLRNSVGIGEDPLGGIWSVENSVDQMSRENKDIHNTNPCEELNYHGIISNANNTLKGANFGYPQCFAVWDPTVLPNPGTFKTGQNFAIGNPSGAVTDATCSSRQAPKLCFPSHTAPLDIKFNPNGTAAYITFHGSWNRNPPDGFRLSKVAFNPSTGMPTEPSTSQTAAQNIMYNANNGACPTRCFRPVGMAWGPKGQLFMTSDSTNEIWVVGGAT
ncbi:soluble quino protein glucose dehydrogenase [Polyplosphaeria fusca]|uniref:Soluble quino protein glucose dehydrogenase n=1 Tax=Polyplosphaeria fusca TaxID=682080 RepID=A0A9P4V205_9PLEO|nr:soluble quino protein glucose dehydrogenase [Polyplosphaeria fusca]